VFDAYAMEDWPLEEGPLRISLNAGRVNSVYDGAAEEDVLLPYIDTIVGRVHSSWHLLLAMAPKAFEVEQRLFQANVAVRAVTLGAWDQQVYERQFPDLSAELSRDSRIHYLAEIADVFGMGAALADLEIGAELAGGRFDSPVQALASTRAGLNFICAHGVIPRLAHWPGRIEGMTPEELVEYFLEVDRAWYEAWIVSQAHEPHTYILGVGRNRHPYSAAMDVGRGGPPEYAREWDSEVFGPPGFRVPAGR
jgi:hypothetical protein